MKLVWSLGLATAVAAAPWPQGGQSQIAFEPPSSAALAASDRLAPLSAASPGISASVRGDELFITHSSFSDHRIRLKNPSRLGCDLQKESQSGYLDTPRGHYYFWWFRRPNKPLATWFNGRAQSFCERPSELTATAGGPGCSSVRPRPMCRPSTVLTRSAPVLWSFAGAGTLQDRGQWDFDRAEPLHVGRSRLVHVYRPACR